MLLDRYLIRVISTSFLAVAIVLTVIFLAYSLTRFLSDAAGGLLNATEVAQLTLYKSAIALEVLLPLAFYFGIIVGFGQLNAHNELTAMRACGMRQARVRRPLLVLGALLAVVIGVLSISVRPWAYSEIFALRDAANAASELDRIKAQRFYLYDSDERAVYIERIANGGASLKGVFIRTRENDDIEVISAPRGTLEPFVTTRHHRLLLSDASIYRRKHEAKDFYGRFASLTLILDAQATVDYEYRTKAESTTTLLAAANADDRAELQWRLSTPVSTVLLMLTALLMVDISPRQGRFSQLPLAIGIYAIYYNVLGVARTWVEQQLLPSMWWVPALLAGALLIVSLRSRRLA